MNFLRLLSAILMLCACFSCNKKESVSLDPSLYVKIPDANFEKKLIELGIDDKQDGQLLKSSAEKVTKLLISFSTITDTIKTLDGIEAFTNLKELYCNSINLVNLDISKNVNLSILSCEGNQLTNLDVSKNVNLDSLDCRSNNLKNLDVSQNLRFILYPNFRTRFISENLLPLS